MNRRGFLAFLLGAPIAAKMEQRTTLGIDWGRGPSRTVWSVVERIQGREKVFLASPQLMKALNNGVFD